MVEMARELFQEVVMYRNVWLERGGTSLEERRESEISLWTLVVKHDQKTSVMTFEMCHLSAISSIRIRATDQTTLGP